jgi:MFS family permease
LDRLVDQPRIFARQQWLMVGLLFLFMVINYADKLVVGIVAIPMRADLGISAAQYGFIGSSFFFLFSISAIVTGFISDRIGTKLIIGVLATVWAFSQLPILWAPSFVTIVLSRIILGMAEGPASPMAVHALYKWFDDRSRTLPAGITTSIGAATGMLVAAPLLTWIMIHYGWRTPFLVLAIIGFFWVLIWTWLGEEGPIRDQPTASGEMLMVSEPYSRTLLCRSYIGLCACGFASYWANALLFLWVPTFLIEAHGYSPATAGWLISLISFATGVGALGASGLSQLAIRRGTTSRKARALPLVLCTFVGGACLLASAFLGTGPALIGVLFLAFGAMAAVFPLLFVIIGELSPTARRGGALAIGSAISTCAGILAPLVMGLAVDAAASPSQGFAQGFLIAAAVAFVSATAGALLIDPQRDGFAYRHRRPQPSHLAEREFPRADDPLLEE